MNAKEMFRVWMDDPYYDDATKAELKEIDAYAVKRGMEFIPCVQTLAHLGKLFRWQPYGNINDCHDILLPEEERTYELIENIFASVAESFTSRRINIGMDEAHFLGRGAYLEKHGYSERTPIILRHLQKVAAIAAMARARSFWVRCSFLRMAPSMISMPTSSGNFTSEIASL